MPFEVAGSRLLWSSANSSRKYLVCTRQTTIWLGAISGFLCELNENCVILGYYAASSVNSLPTFRDNLSSPSSRVGPILKGSLKMGPIDCPETSVRNSRCVTTQKNGVLTIWRNKSTRVIPKSTSDWLVKINALS